MSKRLYSFLAFLVVALAMSVAGLSAPGACLDNNITGDQLMAQQAAYEEARDQVVAIQQGDLEATAAELIVLVQVEAGLATKSWVRAAIYCYLGLLKEKNGDKEGAINAYQAAARYGGKSMKFTKDSEEKVAQSQTEGAKYKAIAEKNLKRLVKK